MGGVKLSDVVREASRVDEMLGVVLHRVTNLKEAKDHLRAYLKSLSSGQLNELRPIVGIDKRLHLEKLELVGEIVEKLLHPPGVKWEAEEDEEEPVGGGGTGVAAGQVVTMEDIMDAAEMLGYELYLDSLARHSRGRLPNLSRVQKLRARLDQKLWEAAAQGLDVMSPKAAAKIEQAVVQFASDATFYEPTQGFVGHGDGHFLDYDHMEKVHSEVAEKRREALHRIQRLEEGPHWEWKRQEAERLARERDDPEIRKLLAAPAADLRAEILRLSGKNPPRVANKEELRDIILELRRSTRR
jgi:hypothetical protein